MNIGIIIGRIGDVDGVALETEKWIHVLKKMGHKVQILSGTFEHDVVPLEMQTKWAGLSFFSPECEWEQNRSFFFPNEDPTPLLDHLQRTSDRIALKIFKWVLTNKIDVILAENSTTLPCHLSMGIGIRKAVKRMGIPVVAHDHDFHWERGDRYQSPHKKIQRMVDEYFPMRLKDVRHAVINSYSKRELKKRFKIDATVVPNVMDFNKPYARKSSYNKDLLNRFNIDIKNDITLFQITRIVRRKGIEAAIELISRLDDKRMKLIITGSAADDERKVYYQELISQIKKLKLSKQVYFGEKFILSERKTGWGGKKIYSLPDAYANADALTYFSTYEGFGNAFVEGVLAKKPIFVNNYKPVYWEDIGSLGFKTVMLEENNLTDHAVKEMKEILLSKKLQKEIIEHNFNLGKKYFSYEVLAEKLETLFNF